MRAYPKSIAKAIVHSRLVGFSVPEISAKFKVSKTTVWRLTHKLSLSDEARSRIQSRRGGSVARKKQNIEIASQEARQILKKSYSKAVNPLILASLYWAEGTKSSFVFTNTDPDMIKVFVHILRNDYKVSNDRFQVLIRIGDQVNVKEILSYWSGVLDLPVSALKVNVNSTYNKTTVRYGLCRITIAKGSQLLKVIMSVNRKLTERILQDKINSLPL